jgi:hypothetical protein
MRQVQVLLNFQTQIVWLCVDLKMYIELHKINLQLTIDKNNKVCVFWHVAIFFLSKLVQHVYLLPLVSISSLLSFRKIDWLIDCWCLTPLSAIFQLYYDDQFYIWKKPEYLERTTDHGQATGSRVHPFCNLQSRARTHAVLVIGLYELLGNPTT